MRTPQVSVGLPVYNGERFLAAAIESILIQDFSDLELLIADNGSSDRTLEIAQAAARRDARVIVHQSPSNRGAAWNHNRLIGLARGRYFKWAAHDDLLAPSCIRRCVEVLQACPGVVLVYPRARDIDAEGRPSREWPAFNQATEDRPSQRIGRILIEPSECFEAFGLVRLADLKRTRGIGPYVSSDRVLLFEFALLGRFYEIPEVLFLHREHDERSIIAYPNSHARNAWFDPARAGRNSAPKWRLLKEYVRAITTAPIALSERLRAVAPLLRWINNNRGEFPDNLIDMINGKAKAASLIGDSSRSDTDREG